MGGGGGFHGAGRTVRDRNRRGCGAVVRGHRDVSGQLLERERRGVAVALEHLGPGDFRIRAVGGGGLL